jgi:hypothetical protein
VGKQGSGIGRKRRRRRKGKTVRKRTWSDWQDRKSIEKDRKSSGKIPWVTVAGQEENGARQEKIGKRIVSDWSRTGRVWSKTGKG